MVNWLALAFPFVYIGLLVGSLVVFSSLYRKRKASKSASLAPWFGPHIQRNIYLSLLHIDPPEDEKTPSIPDSVLKAALLRRATEDILRIVQIRNSKQALASLLQRGSVGDDLWQRFLRAEKEIEEELRDVVNEANAFNPTWGQTIFQSANEIANNALIRTRMSDLQSQKAAEKEWWEKKKASIESEFMKELDGDKNAVKSAATKSPEVKAPAEKSLTMAESYSAMNARNRTSDDDAVLVESGGPVDKAAAGKKKKGRK